MECDKNVAPVAGQAAHFLLAPVPIPCVAPVEEPGGEGEQCRALVLWLYMASNNC